ncbi:DMT family transporter [Aureimonas sp. AU12]|uniref:DMT family transporter n=1 Tax=Aureimonas sp. AU12 TaxID=1638161 RepID=UPI000783D80C|nr:DMT family transporter [Aureimonas sp. AU12]
MLQTLRHPYVLLGLTAFIWGANSVAGKLAVGHVSPMMLTVLRWAIASALLAPFALPVLRRDWPLVRPRLGYFVMLGLLGFTGFNSLFYVAMNYTSAIHSTIVQSSMPLVVFVGMFLVFRAKVTGLQVAGFSLTLLGVLLTAGHGDLTTLAALDLNHGDALMLVAVLFFGAYTIMLSRKPAIHWLSSIFLISLTATLTSLPVAIGEWVIGAQRWPDAQGWGVVAFSVLLPSILSQSLYIKGIEMIGANRANLFVNLVPIFGTILAVAILGEPLFTYHVVALALVLGGITIAERGKQRARVADQPATPVEVETRG